MALRVLLADESSTIKKVFQLALQDFAVDVRPVNVGIDVLPVAKSFKPDIIFADILLQKLNGYDVAHQIKQDPDLGSTPVVLMWSGFMELDEDKSQASKADASLEKPFDVNQLRNLVNRLVPKTQNNRLSQYLSFPKMPDFKEEPKAPPPAPKEDAKTGTTTAVTLLKEDFANVPLPKIKSGNKDKFRVDVDPHDEGDEIPVAYNLPDEKISVDSLLGREEPEQFSVRGPASPKRPPPPPPEASVDLRPEHTKTKSAPQAVAPKLSEKELEAIIREQSKEVIESVVWKVVPELAAQIIERELARLLKERDNSPS